MKEIYKKSYGSGFKNIGDKMVYLFIKHKVKDFDKWKTVFDKNASVRETGGSQGGRLFRNTENPNETIIILEWNSIENAKKFAGSEDLKKAMEKAGVDGKPEIYFLEEVEKVYI
jgi:heme-degrading monooxygenase HmoA